MTEFLLFYSRVMKVLKTFTQLNLVAVMDNIFLCAFLAKAISCEELQTET